MGWRRWGRSRAGVPSPSFPWTSIDDVGPLLIAAVGITLVSLTDTIATATSFAARRGDEVDPDQEMIGLGAANLAAGFFQGFSVSTSGSRTAVAEQSGAKSQLTGVVGAGLVVVLLLFLNSLLADLPQTALAAVVITAALSLMNFQRAAPLLPGAEVVARALTGRHRRGRVLRGARGHRHRDRAVDPHVLPPQLVAPRRGAGTGRRRRRMAQHRGLSRRPVSFPASSCTDGKPRCSSPTPARSEPRSAALARERKPSWIVLQCEAITDIDVTAADMLELLDDELNADGIHLAFAEMRSRLQDLTSSYGLARDPRPGPLLSHPRRRTRRDPGPRHRRRPRRMRTRHTRERTRARDRCDVGARSVRLGASPHPGPSGRVKGESS